MKKLLVLIPLLFLTGCGNTYTHSIYYEPSVPEFAPVIFGTIQDKDDWVVTETYTHVWDTYVYIHYYYSFTILETDSGTSYFVQVTKANYDGHVVGDEISIPYLGGIL